MPETILLTGAGGFIGYHTAATLLAQGYRVVGVDNLCDYYPVSLKRRRLRDLAARDGTFIAIEEDLCNLTALQAAFRQYTPRWVCNLAAQAGVRHSLTDPHAYQRSNLEGFLNILECCRHAGIDRLVYASSSSVYGGNTHLPFAERDRVDTPISLYAATKRANELMAHAYSHLFRMQTVGLRFFTVYGPWGRPDMAMWIFAERILDGRPIPVYNRGDMKRDFTYIDDIVAGICAALFTPGLERWEVFNLGKNRMEQLMDMIHLIERSLDRRAALDLLPMQPGDVPAANAEISLAAAKLGFAPQTPIDVGVPAFCEWYTAHPDLADEVRQWRRQCEF